MDISTVIKYSADDLKNDNEAMDLADYDAVISVDGSYDKNTGKYSYGMKVIDKRGVHYYCKAYPSDDMSGMHNVAGEIAGARVAMSYSRDNGYKKIKLRYDYKGIENWCSGAWAARNKHTMEYKDYYDSIKPHVTVVFEHTKGHSGIEDNEICDLLAKYALGIKDKKMVKYDDILKSAGAYSGICVDINDKYDIMKWLNRDESNMNNECTSFSL